MPVFGLTRYRIIHVLLTDSVGVRHSLGLVESDLSYPRLNLALGADGNHGCFEAGNRIWCRFVGEFKTLKGYPVRCGAGFKGIPFFIGEKERRCHKDLSLIVVFDVSDELRHNLVIAV